MGALAAALAAALYWIGVGQKIIAAGAPVVTQFRQFLVDNGIEADNANLDAQIADDERRKADEQKIKDND